MIKETWNYSWPKYLVKIFTEADMSYNAIIFLFFLVGFLGIYCLLRGEKMKRNWILVGNIVFYVWSGWSAIVIVALTAVIAYLATRKIEKIYDGFEKEKASYTPKEQVAVLAGYKKKAKIFMMLAMCMILAVWFLVKLGKFLKLGTVETFPEIMSGKGIIVPLGISYYTLSVVGYLLDVYWRKAKAEHNFLDLFTVMTYFPHIVQGPISRYSEMIPKLQKIPKFDYERVCFGLQLMLWGYIKKMVIADRLVLYTNAVFGEPLRFAGIEIILAVLLCTVQLYADFSGCIDIVCGISEVIGIELTKNFRQPFFAKDAQEFWARWHMSLGAWTKEYIYLPIAMNPKFLKMTKNIKKEKSPWLASFLKAFCPLIAVWLFTGLWHGTGMDYIVWGLYWCIMMTLGKETKPFLDKVAAAFKINKNSKYFRFWQSVRTTCIFGMGRMFTVAGSLAGCWLLWSQIFKEARLWVLFDGSLYTHGLDRKDFYVALIGMVLMLAVDIIHEKNISIRQKIGGQPLVIRWTIYLAALFTLIIFGMYGPGFDAASFAYGAF